MRAFALPGFATQLFLLTLLPVGPSAGILYDQKGLGWAVVNDPSARRTAQWNGSWSGARSLLRCYRDDALVIAIMSNRTNHTVRDVGTLANDLGDKVLGSGGHASPHHGPPGRPSRTS